MAPILPKSNHLFWATLLIALACGHAAGAQTPDTARMEQVVRADATDSRFTGAVLVAKGDQVLFDRAYGAANLEWAVSNAPDTRFPINSLAKQFTAAAVLLLEERGKLHLTDTVKTWWPDAPPAWDKITLFHLLTQTSGIPDYVDAPDFGDTMKLRKAAQERIATIRDKPLEAAPGEKFAYSNSNYLLLGAIVERVSGQPYASFVQDNIFTPLGMKDSGAQSTAPIPRHASGYVHRDGMIVKATYSDPSAGPGAIFSTTHDLLTWERALLDGKLLSPASLKKMMTPFREANGPGAPFKAGYGMGIYVGTAEDGRREISHTGSQPGFVSMIAAYPDDRLFVILLSNIDSTTYADIASKLANVALGKAVILPDEREQIAVNPGMLARYVGRYQLRPGFVIEIVQNGSILEAHPASNPVIAIYPQSQTSFFGRTVDVQVDFQTTGGSASSLIWRVNGDVHKAPRVP
jgi:CubicO group peptidase (beta-lactamase class C family)